MWDGKVEPDPGGLPGVANPGPFPLRCEREGGLTLWETRVNRLGLEVAWLCVRSLGQSLICTRLLCDVRQVVFPLWVPVSKLGETSGFPPVLGGAPTILWANAGVPVGATCRQLSLHACVQPE